ncbi:MAG TPA: transglutaminase domain-containing protein [Chitinophagaceae bacterium]
MRFASPRQKRLSDLFVNMAALVTIIPLAPLINRYLPPIMIGSWNLDLPIAILLAFLLVMGVIKIFRPLIIPAFLLICLVLVYNLFTNSYTFPDVIHDYKNMVMNNWTHKDQKEKELYLINSIFQSRLQTLGNQLKVKVDHSDSTVRNFAVQHSLESFDEYYPKYGQWVRVLSLFKHINTNFRYVNDAFRDEYFATAKETINNGLGGDCDDHSILMVSAIKAIGGNCRIVLTRTHAYPELQCPDKESLILLKESILHLFGDKQIKELSYHIRDGQYWINLDYTAAYPGGPYLSDTAYAIVEW